MIRHVVDLVDSLGIKEKIIVVGYQGEKVIAEFKDEKGISFVWQKEQKGTGHAVMMAKPLLKDFKGDVLILYADVPGVTNKTMQKLIDKHRKNSCTITILTAKLEDPKWYGRIIKDGEKVIAIREARDATTEELKINEVNSGILIIKNEFLLTALNQLKVHNQQGEYYLTDIIEIASNKKEIVCRVIAESGQEIFGVNYVEELDSLKKIFARQD